jgi:hypothetical protein
MSKRFAIITGAAVLAVTTITGAVFFVGAVVAGTAFLMLGTATAFAGELPSYSIAGLPATQHQMAVIGMSAATQELPAASTFTVGGMPASPHQIAVLSRRPAISVSQVDSAARSQ